MKNQFSEKKRGITTHVRKDYHQNTMDRELYFELESFDDKSAWQLKELDMLEGMGFKVEGDRQMGLNIPGDVEMNKYSIAKHKKLGYELKINERKHFFKTFQEMLNRIDEFGTLDI